MKYITKVKLDNNYRTKVELTENGRLGVSIPNEEEAKKLCREHVPDDWWAEEINHTERVEPWFTRIEYLSFAAWVTLEIDQVARDLYSGDISKVEDIIQVSSEYPTKEMVKEHRRWLGQSLQEDLFRYETPLEGGYRNVGFCSPEEVEGWNHPKEFGEMFDQIFQNLVYRVLSEDWFRYEALLLRKIRKALPLAA